MKKFLKALYAGVATCLGSEAHVQYAVENNLVMPDYLK